MPIFSDFYIDRSTKVEILPTDKLEQKTSFLEEGDRLVTVFRPIESSFVANYLSNYFFEELHSRVHNDRQAIPEAIISTIQACNISLLNSLGEPEKAPKSGAMLLIIYIAPNGQGIVAQVGDITMKQRKDGRFITLTDEHTFDNKVELQSLIDSDFYQKHGGGNHIKLINDLAIDIGLAKNSDLQSKVVFQGVPSRFVGHPNWCGWGGEYGDSFANTMPTIKTVIVEL